MWDPIPISGRRGIVFPMNKTLQSSPGSVALFALDWGTSSCRIWALDATGQTLSTASSENGTLALAKTVDPNDAEARAGAFENELTALAGSALEANPGIPVLACGMVGSSIGWKEAGYIKLPASIAITRSELAQLHLSDNRTLWIVPGLNTDGQGSGTYPDVIRGEETQLIGALSQLQSGNGNDQAAQTIVLPGTHSKWVDVRDGRIEAFTTVMTGEFYALLMDHSILGEPAVTDAAFDEMAFIQGVDLGAADNAGSLAARSFSARGLLLAGKLAPEQIGSYLSGLLIGDEISRELSLYSTDTPVTICGASSLTYNYARAFKHLGIDVSNMTENVTVDGLLSIARSAQLGAFDSARAQSHNTQKDEIGENL